MTTTAAAAEKRIGEFVDEFNTKFVAWTNAVQSPGPGPAQGQAAVDEVLRRWRQYNEELKASTLTSLRSETQMNELAALVTQVSEERALLEKLKSQAVTRTDQADSLNPRIRNSPYTNILGLRRVFRPATWDSLLAAAILFGLLAVLVAAFLIYRVVVAGPQADIKLGGWRGGGGEGGGGWSLLNFKQH